MLDMRHFCLWSATPNHAEPRLCLTDTSAGQSIVDPLRPLVSVALDPLWTIACVQRVVELPWGAVRELEPLHLRLTLINDVTQTIAFLESLNLAHGDLQPENTVLDGDRIKVIDFDNSAASGTPLMVCQEPWGRELRANEGGYNVPGCIGGLLGPRTGQFAPGSIYYLIKYGMEMYGDKNLNDTSRDRDLALRDLLLGSGILIDELIHRCWHSQFPTIASLAAATEALFTQACSEEESNAVKKGINVKLAIDGGESDSNSPIGMIASNLTGCGASVKAFCQELEKHGLFDFPRSKR
ncbi:kinase domain-containing protein [Penicillium desertorum]|uniref:Kinase domain-containing protein n=1 Tax=Penicillium desertorum TaxID=1303715 RepID=A0A9W9WPN4_9EURO|nr:kinase domain-containing protein [Penicillium desertorum]